MPPLPAATAHPSDTGSRSTAAAWPGSVPTRADDKVHTMALELTRGYLYHLLCHADAVRARRDAATIMVIDLVKAVQEQGLQGRPAPGYPRALQWAAELHYGPDFPGAAVTGS